MAWEEKRRKALVNATLFYAVSGVQNGAIKAADHVNGCAFLSEGWEWKICDLRCKKSGVTMKKSPLECAHLNTILIPIFNVRGEPRRVVKKCVECGEILETESIGR
ncbi:MAG: hypothetical protein QXQ94_08790 [Candidatus Bathyarchaeia archaeon]